MASGIRGIANLEFDVKSAKIMLLAAVLALATIGTIMVYSVTSANLASAGQNPYEDVIKQLAYIAAGAAIMIAIWFVVPYDAWTGPLLWVFYAGCMLALVLTYFIGTEVNGAKRWLFIGSMGMQPSEFIKIALLLMTIRIVYIWNRGFLNSRAAFLHIVVFVLLPLGFLLWSQRDFGTTTICFVGIFAILWIGGVPKRLLAMLAGGIFILGCIFVFSVSYRMSRFVFLDPWNDGQGGLGDGYNLIHAFYAIAEGGLFGVGIGSSHEKYNYLFAADSDFIFAVIGEELGLVGALLVIAIFLLILFCGLRIAANAGDSLAAMIVGGSVIMLVFQAFLNIGCAIGVFPTTGKPLPFISSGGSSVISSFILVGLMLSVARAEEKGYRFERTRDSFRVITPARAPKGGASSAKATLAKIFATPSPKEKGKGQRSAPPQGTPPLEPQFGNRGRSTDEGRSSRDLRRTSGSIRNDRHRR